MTDVGYFGSTSLFADKVDLSNGVVGTKFDKAKLEELLWVCVWIDMGVLSGVDGSSVVSEPHIKSCSGKDESW